jgi:hypothetical protein
MRSFWLGANELTKGFAMKTRVTVETISAQLDEDRAFAKSVDQAGPALNATIAKAKLHGLIIDPRRTARLESSLPWALKPRSWMRSGVSWAMQPPTPCWSPWLTRQSPSSLPSPRSSRAIQTRR